MRSLIVNATRFVLCFSPRGAYSAAWLVPARALVVAPPFEDRLALEYATWHMYRHAEPRLKAARDEFWTNHVSGYELSLIHI